MTPLVTRERSRAFDAEWIARGVPGLLLMESAGRGAADRAVEQLLAGHAVGKRVVVLCGRGNNAGDGFVVARRLHVLGARVTVLLVEDMTSLAGDALVHADAFRALGEPLHPWTDAAPLADADLIVDAMFGTGLTRPLTGAAAEAARAVNGSSAPVLALDIPSGLDANTGCVHGATCVRATLTTTFGFAKTGLYTPRASEHTGEVVTIDIGVPAQLRTDEAPAAWLVTRAEARAALQRAPRGSGAHKNANGHVLVIGGSPGKTGAPHLAAYGALRAGAGLVTVASWPSSLVELQSLPMSVMRNALTEDTLADLLPKMRAVVAGPGLGLGDDAARVFERLLAPEHAGALVLDADVFTWAAKRPERLRRSGPTVLTPHPAELARLLDTDTPTIERDRLASARDAAARTGAVVVLKGAHTVVAAPERTPIVSPLAVPALGVAGSGDTLAGIVGALLAAGRGAEEAAWLGVWLHAEAARTVALARGDIDRGLLPTEIADAVPELFARE